MRCFLNYIIEGLFLMWKGRVPETWCTMTEKVVNMSVGFVNFKVEKKEDEGTSNFGLLHLEFSDVTYRYFTMVYFAQPKRYFFAGAQ